MKTKNQRWEVKTFNDKDQIWYCQTFETKREAAWNAKWLRECGRKVKGPMPAKY